MLRLPSHYFLSDFWYVDFDHVDKRYLTKAPSIAIATHTRAGTANSVTEVGNLKASLYWAHNSSMAAEPTKNMNNGNSFEERVFARFDALDSAIRDLDSRVQRLEMRAYDTKPIWEQALKEIVETRRELSKRLDRIEAIAHETRADLRDAEDRIDKLESKPIQ